MFNIEGEYNTASVKLPENEDVEKECRQQIQEMVNHPAFKGDNDVAVMPDTHWGAGAVIGFTMPLKNRVCPNTIGVDIGCGMYAAKLSNAPLNDLESLDKEIRDKIPTGFNVHNRTDYHFKKDFPWQKCREKAREFNENSDLPDLDTEYGINYFKNLLNKIGYETGRTINSMGTLGGGNHFIEIGESQETQDTWCIIHSGSRGVGARIAEYWQDKATELRNIKKIRETLTEDLALTIVEEEQADLTKYVKFSEDDSDEEILEWLNGAKGESYKKKEKIREDFNGEEIEEIHNQLRRLQIHNNERNTDLDYLEGEEATGYIKDMIFAQTYASQSRKEMMEQVTHAFNEVHGQIPLYTELIESVHNYIDFTDQTIRKGACSANKNEKIVIPFNMNYGTLIAEGKGKKDWNNSAPHGAGRAMSRTQAKKQYSTEDMENQTEGVYMSKKPVDETPEAYKKPELVENAVGETAEIIDRVKPVLSIKAE